MAETLDRVGQGESVKRHLNSDSEGLDTNGEETPSKRPKLDESHNAIPNHTPHPEEDIKAKEPTSGLNGAIEKTVEDSLDLSGDRNNDNGSPSIPLDEKTSKEPPEEGIPSDEKTSKEPPQEGIPSDEKTSKEPPQEGIPSDEKTSKEPPQEGIPSDEKTSKEPPQEGIPLDEKTSKEPPQEATSENSSTVEQKLKQNANESESVHLSKDGENNESKSNGNSERTSECELMETNEKEEEIPNYKPTCNSLQNQSEIENVSKMEGDLSKDCLESDKMVEVDESIETLESVVSKEREILKRYEEGHCDSDDDMSVVGKEVQDKAIGDELPNQETTKLVDGDMQKPSDNNISKSSPTKSTDVHNSTSFSGEDVAEGEDLGDDEDDVADGEGGGGAGQRSRRTRSQTRKAQPTTGGHGNLGNNLRGIQDEKPKSIYVELEESDFTDDSAPSSPWIDPFAKLSPQLLDYRSKVSKKLGTMLRNQESKLLLLKKLRLNQQQPAIVQTTVPTQNTTLPQHAKISLPQNANNATLQQRGRFVPGNVQARPTAITNQQHHPIQRPQMPQLMRAAQNIPGRGGVPAGHTGPPPLMMSSQGNKVQQVGQLSVNRVQNQQNQLIRHQNMKQAANQNIPQQPQQHRHQVNNQSMVHNQQNSRVVPGVNAMTEAQSAASRQAAAKLALRKQLEKTLLQIPPPKPPPPELHFLPSAANNEFIILVGLEEVVNTILSLSDHKKEKKSPEFIKPFKCSQCKTDFTTIWKHDSKQGIMCEACIVTNQKRALKAEHTNRLKTAFVKALQQEQEIEQRMQQSQAKQQSHPVHTQQPPSQQQMYAMTTQALPTMRRVLNPIPAQRLPQYSYLPQMAVPSSQQIQMITKQQLNAVYHHSTAAADRQRQREYLLDMIPSSGLSKQWKH